MDTGVHADDLVQAPSIGQLQPGKRNLVQGTQLGVAHIDDGHTCERDPADAGCFLTDKQRMDVLADVDYLLGVASKNYTVALQDLKTRELLRREEDLHWALGLVLDVATVQLATIMQTALKSVQARASAKIEQMLLSAGASGSFSDRSWQARAEQLVAVATTARIDKAVSTAFVPVAGAAKKTAQRAVNAATESTKAATLAYVDHLAARADAAFYALRGHLRAHVKDAELVVVWEGLRPEHHEIGMYRVALSAKIDRFLRSGVRDIGRDEARADAYGRTVIRDTRVVYVQDIFGGKTAWYERVDGDHRPGLALPGDPLFERLDPASPEHQRLWQSFGSRASGEPTLDRPVPEEFRDTAIAYSEARWGLTSTIDDGYVASLKRQGVNVADMRTRLRGAPVTTLSSVFHSSAPSQNPTPSTASGLQGSVLDPQNQPSSLPPGSIFGNKP